MNELKSVYIDRTGDWVTSENDTGKFYLKEEADKVIAELKDKCQMHDFFWEGCGFAKRGFKNTIAVSEAYDFLEAENVQLKESVAAYQRNEKISIREIRMLKKTLYKACANWATFAVAFFSSYKTKNRWNKMKLKCQAKAEEYK